MALREQPTILLAFCMAMGAAAVLSGACGIRLFMDGSNPLVLVAGSALIGFGGITGCRNGNVPGRQGAQKGRA